MAGTPELVELPKARANFGHGYLIYKSNCLFSRRQYGKRETPVERVIAGPRAASANSANISHSITNHPITLAEPIGASRLEEIQSLITTVYLLFFGYCDSLGARVRVVVWALAQPFAGA